MPAPAQRANERPLGWCPIARRDILSIVAFTAAHNPTAARGLLDAYQEALVTLRAHPEAGLRYIPDHATLGTVRVLPLSGYPDYLIFSRFDDATVDMLPILYSSRGIHAAPKDRRGTLSSHWISDL